ncbi:unnamed protein product, partial [Urochloa humidicola]
IRCAGTSQTPSLFFRLSSVRVHRQSRAPPPLPVPHAAVDGGIHAGYVRGAGGEKDGGRHAATGTGRGNGGVAQTRPRGGGEAQMQTPSTSTDVEAASGVRLPTAVAGRKAPPRSSSSMAKKRKIDGVDPALLKENDQSFN